jgi:hypothetical protein
VSLRLPPKLKPGAGLRAVLRSLAMQAKRDVERMADHPEQRIHSLRTSMKKFRSLLRLADAWTAKLQKKALRERIRILKDEMAGSRDETVIYKTVEKVLGEKSVRRLGLKCPRTASAATAPLSLLMTADELVVLTETLAWDKVGVGKLRERWKDSLGDARQARQEARHSGVAHDFHMWRKRVKDIWYQSAALDRLGKKIGAVGKDAKKLSEVLGEEHDLTMVLEAVKKLTPDEKATLENARGRLRDRAFALAKDARI